MVFLSTLDAQNLFDLEQSRIYFRTTGRTVKSAEKLRREARGCHVGLWSTVRTLACSLTDLLRLPRIRRVGISRECSGDQFLLAVLNGKHFIFNCPLSDELEYFDAGKSSESRDEAESKLSVCLTGMRCGV